MKLLVLLLCLFTHTAFAQTKTYEALQVSPQPLKHGQTVTLTYQPEKGKLQAQGDPIYAVLLAYKAGAPVAKDTVMQTGKKGLKASFLLPDSIDAVAFKFMQGSKEDANDGNGYFMAVADKQGKALPGTNASLARIYNGDYLAGISNPKPELGKKYNDAWMATQDMSTKPYMERLLSLYRQKDTTALCHLLKDLPQQPVLKEDDFSTYEFFARNYCKDAALISTVDAEMRKRYPNGRWTVRPWFDSLRRAATPAEKLVWVKAFQLSHPDDAQREKPYAQEMYSEVARAAASAIDLKTLQYALPFVQKDPAAQENLASLYNTFAWQCALKDTLLKPAAGLSAQSLRILDDLKATGRLKPPYLSGQMYAKNIDYSYSSYADTYAFLLYKLQQYDSALHYAGIAARQRDWKGAEINEHYFLAMEKVKPAKEVLTAMETAFLNDGYTSAMEAQYVRLAPAAGIADGDAAVKALVAKARDKKFADFKGKMIKETAPAFTLNGLDGQPVSLESLKGKVVVIDFWATWCGPCIASFPGMQKVVDAHRNDAGVTMLFVNTWQSEEDKLKTVSDFLEGKTYTFKVLMDMHSKVVEQFKVDGIPTKFIIDKQGNIRFKSVGYNGSTDKTFDEMEIMIELAKAES